MHLCCIWMFRLAARPLLPNSHQPKDNWEDSETPKFQVNPARVSEQMNYPGHALALLGYVVVASSTVVATSQVCHHQLFNYVSNWFYNFIVHLRGDDILSTTTL